MTPDPVGLGMIPNGLFRTLELLFDTSHLFLNGSRGGKDDDDDDDDVNVRRVKKEDLPIGEDIGM